MGDCNDGDVTVVGGVEQFIDGASGGAREISTHRTIMDHNVVLLLLSPAPTAPPAACVGMNAARRFSCLCCDAVKGMLGNIL